MIKSSKYLWVLLSLLACLLIGFIDGCRVASWHNNVHYKNDYEALIKRFNAYQSSSQRILADKEAQLNQYQQSLATLEKVKQDEQQYPVYIDCKLPASGLQLNHERIERANEVITTR